MFFFFFQAEDGIRDLTVTGVQTCALPISGALGSNFTLQVTQLTLNGTPVTLTNALRISATQNGVRPTSAAVDFTTPGGQEVLDRKSTRLNSSHSQISYAVFCLKKKKTNTA